MMRKGRKMSPDRTIPVSPESSLEFDRWFGLVIAGPSGSGKTTVGQMIARELGLPFVDADDFHHDSAVQKMRNRHPLTDEERDSWVQRIIGAMTVWRNLHRNTVVACSCLRRVHRKQIVQYGELARIKGGHVIIVWLDVDRDSLKGRLEARDEEGTHFFPAALLDSQLDAVERPVNEERNVIIVDGRGATPEEIARRVWEAVPMIHPWGVRPAPV